MAFTDRSITMSCPRCLSSKQYGELEGKRRAYADILELLDLDVSINQAVLYKYVEGKHSLVREALTAARIKITDRRLMQKHHLIADDSRQKGEDFP
jgi:hypothetical protein